MHGQEKHTDIRSLGLQALRGCDRVWVVEQNHGGQLFHYLKSLDALPAGARSLARPGPLPLRPGDIVAALSEEA